MTPRVFDIPEPNELFDALGAEPQLLDADGTQVVRVRRPNGEEVALTLDPAGRSVGVEWRRDGAVVLRTYREGAVRAALMTTPERTAVVLRFETDDLAGQLEVQVEPFVAVTDTMLRA